MENEGRLEAAGQIEQRLAEYIKMIKTSKGLPEIGNKEREILCEYDSYMRVCKYAQR